MSYVDFVFWITVQKSVRSNFGMTTTVAPYARTRMNFSVRRENDTPRDKQFTY